MALAENIADFGDLERRAHPGRGHDHVDKDLETIAAQLWRRLERRLAAHQEEPAHRIADRLARNHAGKPIGQVAARQPGLAQPVAGRPTIGKARPHHQIGAGHGLLQHGGQHGLVMLQIAIDDRHIGSRGHRHALDAGRCQAPAAEAAQAADIAVDPAELIDHVGRTIGAVIVHHDHFPGRIAQGQGHLFIEQLDIVALVIAGHDHGPVDMGENSCKGWTASNCG